jgi:hypothetical protein
MGITRKAAVQLGERAQAMARRLVAADQQQPAAGVVSLAVVEIQIEQQLSLFPLAG